MRIFLIPLGIALIFGGPYVLWDAEFQHRASDFQEANWVEPESDETGHIKVQGMPASNESFACPEKEEGVSNGDCVLISTTERQYVRKEVEECSTSRPSNVLEKRPEQCDSNGENCKPCYLVEKKLWETTNSSTDFASFTIGNYEVPSEFDAEILGQDSFTTYTAWEELEDSFGFYEERTPTENSAEPGDISFKYSYLPMDDEFIVSGYANEKMEIGAGASEKTFVISSLSEAETFGTLEAKDTSSKWMLRVLSMVMVVFGFMFIFNTIAALPLMLVKIIPFLGKKLEEGLSGIVSFIAGLIGLTIWALMWVTVILLKNIVALIVIAGVIGLVAVAVVMFAKKHHIPLKKKAKEITKEDLKK